MGRGGMYCRDCYNFAICAPQKLSLPPIKWKNYRDMTQVSSSVSRGHHLGILYGNVLNSKNFWKLTAHYTLPSLDLHEKNIQPLAEGPQQKSIAVSNYSSTGNHVGIISRSLLYLWGERKGFQPYTEFFLNYNNNPLPPPKVFSGYILSHVSRNCHSVSTNQGLTRGGGRKNISLPPQNIFLLPIIQLVSYIYTATI